MAAERGQALVEAIVAFPVCVACALTLVDCGVLVRDRIVVTQAATRAAEAHLVGDDELAAARAALPRSLASHLQVDVREHRVVVSTRSGARIARLAGSGATQRSSADFDVMKVAR